MVPHDRSGSMRSVPATITSLDNPLVKELVRLHARSRQDPTFLAEGERCIAGCLAAGAIPLRFVIGPEAMLPRSFPAEVERIAVSQRVLAKLSQVRTPPGVIAHFQRPTPPPLQPGAGGLICVGIADPGNLGALLRCAAAFAVRQVVLLGGTDPFAGKCVQAAAGTLASVPLYDAQAGGDAGTLCSPSLLAAAAPLCALVARGGRAPRDLPPIPRWLVIGNEAHGLPRDVEILCIEQLTLPMPGGVESLNAAMAGAIACWALGPGR